MRSISVCVLVLALLAAFSVSAVADEPESGLFPVTDEMASFQWFRVQGTVKSAGSVSGVVADVAGNTYDVHVGEAVIVDERIERDWRTWRYQYFFMNWSDMPVSIFTVPGLPSKTLWAIETIYGRVTSVIRLEPRQGIRFVFYDTRSPKPDVERIAYVLSPENASRILGFGVRLWIPDPALPEY